MFIEFYLFSFQSLIKYYHLMFVGWINAARMECVSSVLKVSELNKSEITGIAGKLA